jgi:nitrous oxidase accessory protein NosD
VTSTNIRAEGFQWDFFYKVTDERYYYNDLSLSGNIEIHSGGTLKLENCTITLISNCRIDVYSGGKLILNNVKFIRDETNTETENWSMRIYDGAAVNITNSVLNCIGWTGNNIYFGDSSSIWINSSRVVIKNNTFTNMEFTPIVITSIKNSSLDISNNTFKMSQINSGLAGIYLYDAQGLLNQGGFTIQNNSFSNLKGIFGYRSTNFDLSNNQFIMDKQHEWSSDSSIELDNCSFVKIRDNNFQFCVVAIYAANNFNLTISNNSIVDTKYPVRIFNTAQLGLIKNDFIRNNVFYSNFNEADVILGVDQSNISQNKWIYRNKLEMPIDPLHLENTEINFQNNIDTTNMINDAPLHFLKNQYNTNLDFTGVRIGHIIMINCSMFELQNAIIKNAGGIYIEGQSKIVTLTNVSVSNPYTVGVRIGNQYSSYDEISLNNCTISGSPSTGLVMTNVRYFEVRDCNIKENRIGAYFQSCYYGNIHHNDIIQNGNPLQKPVVNNETFPFFGGLLFQWGESLLIKNNQFVKNYYWAISFGRSNFMYGQTNHNQVSENQFIQYISPKEKKYSVCVYDYSDNNTYTNNLYSDYFFGQFYKVNGTTEARETINQAIYNDQDGDGVYDITEFAWGSKYGYDTDGDNVTDYDEIVLYRSDPTKLDTDGDGLDDYLEIVAGSDLLNPDTDSDGYFDGEEYRFGSSPTNSTSFPGSNINVRNYAELNDEGQPERVIHAINGYSMIFLAFCCIITTMTMLKRKNRKINGGNQ